MVEFRHILATTDMTDSSGPALAYASAFASGYGAHLALLHVVPTFDAIQMPPGTLGDAVQMVYPSSREEVIATMQRQVESAGLPAASLYLMAEAGDPVDTIVDQAISIPADLIVMGTHGRSGFNRMLFGSVTEHVLHRSPCPVLTVPPHSAVAPADAWFKRILCAMDFSPAAMQALGFALELGRQSRGLVIVQHAIGGCPTKSRACTRTSTSRSIAPTCSRMRAPDWTQCSAPKTARAWTCSRSSWQGGRIARS